MKEIKIGNYVVGKKRPLLIISGPCVIESEEHTLYTARELKKIFSKHSFSFVFKASYDKANRSSIHSFRGVGVEKGLSILAKVKKELHVPVLSDIHSVEEANSVKDVLDMIQIPAFLCRQTDLLVAAAKTSLPVNVKKGQFVAPWDMRNVVEKLIESGNENILLTERGCTFGYNNLVSDMRSIPIMQSLGFPVCFDATHSVQLPGALKNSSGGEREYSPLLAKAAITSGCNALFIEAHPNPKEAKSDSATVMDFQTLEKLLDELEKLYPLIQSFSL